MKYTPLSSQPAPPHLIIEVVDKVLGKLGYLVLDRPVQGSAFGPVLFASDSTLDDLIFNARAMTYKWAFVHVPLGGAFAGICADPRQLGCSRAALMETFGRLIAPLIQQRVYYPGIDIGMTLEDLQAIMRGAGQSLVGPQIDSSFCTGLTVFETIRQVTRHKGLELSHLQVAMEGFGKVGSVVAKLLAQAGAKIVALSTSKGAIMAAEGLDISRLLSLKQQYGGDLVKHYTDAQPITQAELFFQPVDLLIPGAWSGAIHADNAEQVQARMIVPVSNAAVTGKAEQMLTDRGVVVIPDFVANCGGVLAVDMRGAGFGLDEVRQVIKETFAPLVVNLLECASQKGQSIGEIARVLAWQNHLDLNGSKMVSADKRANMISVIKSQGLKGMYGRVAWKVHRYWPNLSRDIRKTAASRFTDWRLNETRNRVSFIGSHLSHGQGQWQNCHQLRGLRCQDEG